MVKEGKKIKNAVGHLVGNYAIALEQNKITIQGQLGWAKQKQMTPANLMILRIVMLGFGRFFPNLIRKLLQKILIVGKKDAPFWFQRQLFWENGKFMNTVFINSYHFSGFYVTNIIGFDQIKSA